MSQFGAILKQKSLLLLAHKFDNLLLTIWTLVSVEPQTEHKKTQNKQDLKDNYPPSLKQQFFFTVWF